MQTTHKIPGASASSYSTYLTSTASRGDYYSHEGEDNRPVPSRWHGATELLGSLGLDPEKAVERSELREVMNGRSPLDGEPLRPAGSDGTRVAGVELMLAPPKSVSALWAVSDPYRRAQIEVAHRKATEATLKRTIEEVPLVRRKVEGEIHLETAKGLLAAEFIHTSSRLAKDQEAAGIPDPQLHSHLIVFAAQRHDGKLAAVESRQLYRAARENGAFYRAELAANLADLGLELERRTGKGHRYFELAGVPKDLASRWSARSEEVDRAARAFRQRYGREPRAGELGSLTVSTRGSKSAADEIDVNEAWRAIGEEHGLCASRAEDLFEARQPSPVNLVRLRAELLEEATRERSTITTRELRAKAYELAAGLSRPEQAREAIEQLQRAGELVRLRDDHWTTRRLRELEQATIRIAELRREEHPAQVGEASLRQARREAVARLHGALSSEQRQALETVTGFGGVSVLLGPAGTGKGVVIGTAARAWQLEGYEVIGTAVAGATAQRLAEDAKFDRSLTLDALNKGVEEGRVELGPRSVVVLDEAAMADTERLARVVRNTANSCSKLLLVGDDAQLGPIGPGGLFSELRARVPSAELREVHRARHKWERSAWEQIRAGEPGPALAAYRARDRLHVCDTREEAAEAMVEQWDRARGKSPGGRAVMITDASNAERDRINAMAQERRAEAGELGATFAKLPGKPYGLAAGDEVIFSAALRVPGGKRVENGITGTVLEPEREGNRVTIATDERESREVQVDTERFSDLGLAYALHLYKAQGITAERAGVLIGGWQTHREHAYVALSRAREETQIYVAREDLGEAGMDEGALERLAERMRDSVAQEASMGRSVNRSSAEPIPSLHLSNRTDRGCEP